MFESVTFIDFAYYNSRENQKMCNFAEEIEDMANEINNSKRDLTILSNGLATSDSEYVRLVSLITNLAKDLTRLRGRGFSRSNLIYMRKFYLTFPKSETLSHQLTWSHYFELLKCDDTLEMQFYMNQGTDT